MIKVAKNSEYGKEQLGSIIEAVAIVLKNQTQVITEFYIPLL